MTDTLIFLYPQEDIFQQEIHRGAVFLKDPKDKEEDVCFIPETEATKTEEEKEKIWVQARRDMAATFRPIYSEALNSCIDLRYRRRKFSIHYAVLEDCEVSDVIVLQPSDKIIKVGMDSKTHRTKREDGTYPYPDQDYILNQLHSPERLVVAGFHMWDCVEKLAERAHQRGIETLVDEDLTEFFPGILNDKDFRLDTYPTYDARKHQKKMFDMFMAARKNKPWLWQNY